MVRTLRQLFAVLTFVLIAGSVDAAPPSPPPIPSDLAPSARQEARLASCQAAPFR